MADCCCWLLRERALKTQADAGGSMCTGGGGGAKRGAMATEVSPRAVGSSSLSRRSLSAQGAIGKTAAERFVSHV